MATSLVWLWIPVTLFAAFGQTLRNVAQKGLTKAHGTLAATLVRFLYGLPFALLWLGALTYWSGTALPQFSMPFLAWILAGGVSQILATALLLAAMEHTNFAVASAYSKTEIMQVGVFSAVLLGESVTALAVVAIMVATAGLVLLSIKDSRNAGRGGWLSTAAVYGIASGALFAMAAVGFRGATVALQTPNPAMAGAYTVTVAQVIQTLLLGSYLHVRQPGSLAALAGAWRASLPAGFLGAAASIAWSTAFAMRNATDVRTLGLLVEVLLSYVVGRRLFGEKMSRTELVALALLVSGLALLCLQL